AKLPAMSMKIGLTLGLSKVSIDDDTIQIANPIIEPTLQSVAVRTGVRMRVLHTARTNVRKHELRPTSPSDPRALIHCHAVPDVPLTLLKRLTSAPRIRQKAK